jgi:hypothetical protein
LINLDGCDHERASTSALPPVVEVRILFHPAMQVILTILQASALSMLVFFAAVLKNRDIDLLCNAINRVIIYEDVFSVLAERLLLQIVNHSNKYTFQNFKNPDYCNVIKCLDIIISTSSDIKAIEEDSVTLILGQVVLFCNQGELTCALAAASKINLGTVIDEAIFITLAHHVCISHLTDGNFDAAIDYFTNTVLKMSLRREFQYLL